MKTAYAWPGLLASVFLLTGCATITSSEMQTVMLSTKSADGSSVDKASCVLRNDKGQWTSQSPSQVAIRRSAEDLIVTCKKDATPDGQLRAVSRAAAGMFGNIIFGGGIGAIIDHTKGTGYNYPDELPVKMGAFVTVDRHQSAAEPSPRESGAPSNEPAKPGSLPARTEPSDTPAVSRSEPPPAAPRRWMR